MVLIAAEELIDVNPWHGLRFGNLEPVEEGSLKQYYVAGSLYDVALSGRGLEVQRDGRRLFATDSAVEIRHVEFHQDEVSFEVRTRKPVKVWVGTGPAQEFPVGLSRGRGRT
jgi:hypothetical protein